MIDAILNKKIEVKLCEDSLTSAIFSLLKYLPGNIIENLLKNSTINDSPKNYLFGDLIKIEFWPKYPANDTSNSRFVEPDIFFEFSNVYIIIEAKRYERFQQNRKQWENEIISFFNYYTTEKPLLFYALGGLFDKGNESINIKNIKIPIYKLNWSSLLRAITSIKHSKILSHYDLIIKDIFSLSEMFGFYTGDTLSTLAPKNITSHNLNILLRLGFNKIQLTNFATSNTKEILTWKTIY